METKHYTPAIEEFHVGFEYEFLQNEIWTSCNDFSYDFLNDDTDTISEVKFYLDESRIRVKYLDREDCLDLGLNLKVWDNGSGYFEKGDFTIGIYSTGLFCTISQNDNKNHIMRFSGDLKNKSELKRILKQLNIVCFYFWF